MATKMVVLLKLVAGFCLLAVVSSQSVPIVSTTLGSLKGSILKTEKNADIYAFRGIPYAQPPVGDLRFKAPVAVTKWETELDATKDGFMCPQGRMDPELLSEDCLFLNVYSRDLKGNQSVIVYIHGGANLGGGSHSVDESGPDYLLDKNVVLVTLNYRLGAFGFVSTRTADAPGNYGYLDQNMALQWVHDHISNFGGNPESVTLFGQSAGSMAVTLHMSSPLSKGLFHKVIAMSGSATNHQAIDNLHWTRQLARDTSCPLYNPVDLLSCLRKVPWQTLINVSDKWHLFGFVTMKWNYEVDGHFLEDTPTNIFAQGKFHKVPILAGLSKDEFTYMVYSQEKNTGLLNDLYLNFEKYGPELLLYDVNANNDKLKPFYLGNQTIIQQDLSHLGQVFTDAYINHGVHRLVDLARQYVDVYYYRFDYAGRYGLYSDADGKSRGANHVDDFQYVMKRTHFKGQIGLEDPEWFMVERLVGWFTTFAQTSSPGESIWLPSNKKIVRTLYNDKEIHLGEEPFKARFELWDQLYPIARSGGAQSKPHNAGKKRGHSKRAQNTHSKRF